MPQFLLLLKRKKNICLIGWLKRLNKIINAKYLPVSGTQYEMNISNNYKIN